MEAWNVDIHMIISAPLNVDGLQIRGEIAMRQRARKPDAPIDDHETGPQIKKGFGGSLTAIPHGNKIRHTTLAYPPSAISQAKDGCSR